MILKIHILLIVLYPHQTNHCKWLHKIHVTYLLLLFFLYTLRKHTCRIRIANKFIQVLFKLNRDITACLWGLQKCLETIEQETGLHVDIHAQMASPKTLTMQYMVLFSHRTVQLPVEKQKSVSLKAISLLCLDLVRFALKKKNEIWNACPVLQYVLPSVLLSQKHELAVCKPAPFFWSMMHVTGWTNTRDCI